MEQQSWLAERFEEQRGHLRAVAYRMLGSLSEADDAVQEAWLCLSRTGADDIDNLGGWLTTATARVCLDMLRQRAARREVALPPNVQQALASPSLSADPEHEALLADSVGLAMLVILDTLAPPERLAFVLHDMFAVPFDDIAPIIGRSPAATRQIASRARRRIQGVPTIPNPDYTEQRRVVDAFLAAARSGDFEALLNVLDPQAILRSDAVAARTSGAPVLHGAMDVAKRAVTGGARAAQAALVNGNVGILIAPRGRLLLILEITTTNGRITTINSIGDPTHLRQYHLALLPTPPPLLTGEGAGG